MGQEVEPRARPLRHPEVDRCIDGIEPKIESGGPGHKVDRDVSVLGEKAGKPGHQPAGAEQGEHRDPERAARGVRPKTERRARYPVESIAHFSRIGAAGKGQIDLLLLAMEERRDRTNTRLNYSP